MAEAATVEAPAGSRPSVSTSAGGSRRSHHDHTRRRRHRHSYAAADTSELSAHGSTSQATARNVDRGTMTDLPSGRRELPPGRRGAIRRRHSAAVTTLADAGDRAVDIVQPRHLFVEEDILARRHRAQIPAGGVEGIDALDDALAWDADRFVAVIRQRRDLFFGMTDDDLLNVLIADDAPGNGERAEPTYPVGEAQYAECIVCMEWKNLHTRVCCGITACDDCLRQYVTTQVSQAIIKIQCIGTCDASMHRDEILARLDNADKTRYIQFLIDANVDPLRRTCPRCNHVTAVDGLALSEAGKYGLMVTCAECHLDWCYPCHAPWHDTMRCSDFRRGDKLLKAWAREQHFGQVNAQKCPKCKFYIQRSSGCDHMTCSRCKTDFCYRCGERFRELKFVGNHYSKLSIFGCKYRFKPTQPIQRRLIRGSIFAAQLLAVPALAALAVGAGAVVASVGSLVLPFYAGYKLHKRLERRRSAKRRRRAREAMWHKLEDMRWRGEELDISHPMLTELDTTQIIRSFIGIDIASGGGSGGINGSLSAAGLDGSAADGASTTDDAHSGLSLDRDVSCDSESSSESSSDDDDDDDIGDDYSLHIRDEACQTGDDIGGGASDLLLRYSAMVETRKENATQLGFGEIGLEAEGLAKVEEDRGSALLSPWASLLGRENSGNDVENTAATGSSEVPVRDQKHGCGDVALGNLKSQPEKPTRYSSCSKSLKRSCSDGELCLESCTTQESESGGKLQVPTGSTLKKCTSASGVNVVVELHTEKSTNVEKCLEVTPEYFPDQDSSRPSETCMNSNQCVVATTASSENGPGDLEKSGVEVEAKSSIGFGSAGFPGAIALQPDFMTHL